MAKQCMCEQPGVPCPLHGEVAWVEPLHGTCINVTAPQFGEAPGSSWVCGPECPRPAGPDLERDKRIDIYRDRERRRAARALDRYWKALQDGRVQVSAAAGDRVIELIGDYVLARLGEIEGGPGPVLETRPMTPSEVEGFRESWAQHNRHYGAGVDTEDATVLPSRHDNKESSAPGQP